MLLDTKTVNTDDFNSIAALTYNDQECDFVMSKIWEQIAPDRNGWEHILKALKLLDHLVRSGSERVINNAWDHDRMVKRLDRYNSALAGFHGKGTGRDEGGPIRELSMKLTELLGSTEKLREVREGGYAHLGKAAPQKSNSGPTDPYAQKPGQLGFGSGGGAPIGAKGTAGVP